MPNKPCEEPGCIIKTAKFGTPDKIEDGRYCSKHKKAGMVNIYTYKKMCRCKPPLKKKNPNYGFPGGKAVCCNDCKTDGMINVLSKKCIGCKSCIPSYGKKGTKKAMYCAKCIKTLKLKGYVDVTHKRCECPENAIARFGKPGKSATHCNDCKTKGMINVTSNKCIVCKKIRAGYERPGKKPKYCFKHKKKGMVDVISKRCAQKGCNEIQPKYNVADEKSGKYCSDHKKKGMINVKKDYCQYKNCTIQAQFNLPDIKKGKYCAEHKKDDMIDVLAQKCLAEGCTTRPSFGYLDPVWLIACYEHKDDEMVAISGSKCIEEGCTKRPHYNIMGETNGKYCVEHKEENMILLCKQKCIIELCPRRVRNELYNNHCYQCFVIHFPDHPVAISYLVKEKVFAEFIKGAFPRHDISYNKIIKGGSSKRRPDVLIKLSTHYIIAENDENGHSGYDEEDEDLRMQEIWNDVKKKPIVFIRFNSDAYLQDINKKIPSPWKKTLKGTVLNDDHIDDWKNRMKLLRKKIIYWMNNIPENTITIEYLFYNYNQDKLICHDW